MAKHQRDYYEILGVDRKATAEQIRSAYRKLARKFHPDVNKAADANKKFAEVQEAYDVLSDAQKRSMYDRFGHAGVGAAGAGAYSSASGRGPRGGAGSPFGGGWGGGGSGGGVHWSNVEPGDFDAGDFASIFEQMFGGAGRGSPFGGGRAGGGAAGARARHAPAQPQRGHDIEHTITVSFLTAAWGGTEELRFSAPSAGGGGASTIGVKIPPGIENGAKLRLRGKGQPAPAGGTAGDLILTVEVGKHPYFRREGLDLIIDVPITIAEAVSGVTVTVPLLPSRGGAKAAGGGGGDEERELSGRSLQLKVPPGSSSGKRLRVKGKGITNAAGASGDYYAVIQIVAPAAVTLSEHGRDLVGQLASELKNPRESAPWVDDIRPPT